MSNKDELGVSNIQYHLHNLTHLDNLVTKIREHFSNEGKRTFWLLKPFGRALISTPFQLDNSSTWADRILHFVINPFSIYLLGTMDLLGPLVDFLKPIVNNLPPYALLGVAVVFYAISVVKGFFKQVDIFDDTFDLNAFKSFFPVLYENLRVFKNTEPFSFNALMSHIDSLSSGSYEVVSDAMKQITALVSEKDEISSRLEHAEELLGKLTYELEISKLLFDKAINAFQAVNHDAVTKDILHILTDFALFKLQDDKLIAIAKHHAYNTPDEIDLHDPKTKSWAAVKVVHAKDPKEYLEADQSHDRVVIANKLVIDGETYVYTYHFPRRQFDEYTHRVTEANNQTLLYNLIFMYNKEKGGN